MSKPIPTPSQLIAAANGQVQSTDGWVLRPLSPDLLEYARGGAACLINVGHPTRQHVRPIYLLACPIPRFAGWDQTPLIRTACSHRDRLSSTLGD
jgi:hypothetical protein